LIGAGGRCSRFTLPAVRHPFEEEIEPTVCRFGEPLITDGHAAVEYWAQSHYASGPLAIAGVTLLRFNEEGLVKEARGYSFVEPGIHSFREHLPL
jgi:hypothetical protein